MRRSFTFLGTGTSQGVPVIGCDCDVCTSTDPRDKRLRTSGLLTVGDKHIVIDVGPDFRQQMLAQKIHSLEAVLLTHEHNDHIIGMDDIRPLYFRRGTPVPVYGMPRVLEEVKERFGYFFSEEPYPGVPRIEPVAITSGEVLNIAGQKIEPVEVWHGKMPILGFRFDDLVYITDANRVEESEFLKIKDCRILILNALHHREHHSHFNLEQAVEFIRAVRPEEAWLIHLSHQMGKHRDLILPQGIRAAYDGLTIDF